jgi:hypothetical protein
MFGVNQRQMAAFGQCRGVLVRFENATRDFPVFRRTVDGIVMGMIVRGIWGECERQNEECRNHSPAKSGWFTLLFLLRPMIFSAQAGYFPFCPDRRDVCPTLFAFTVPTDGG